jgi:hypothetical protein
MCAARRILDEPLTLRGLVCSASHVLLKSRSGRRLRQMMPLRSQQTNMARAGGLEHLRDGHTRGTRANDEDLDIA